MTMKIMQKKILKVSVSICVLISHLMSEFQMKKKRGNTGVVVSEVSP